MQIIFYADHTVSSPPWPNGIGCILEGCAEGLWFKSGAQQMFCSLMESALLVTLCARSLGFTGIYLPQHSGINWKTGVSVKPNMR